MIPALINRSPFSAAVAFTSLIVIASILFGTGGPLQGLTTDVVSTTGNCVASCVLKLVPPEKVPPPARISAGSEQVNVGKKHPAVSSAGQIAVRSVGKDMKRPENPLAEQIGANSVGKDMKHPADPSAEKIGAKVTSAHNQNDRRITATASTATAPSRPTTHDARIATVTVTTTASAKPSQCASSGRDFMEKERLRLQADKEKDYRREMEKKIFEMTMHKLDKLPPREAVLALKEMIASFVSPTAGNGRATP